MINNYSRLKFFKGFSQDEVSTVVRQMIPVSYGAGETIIKEDEVSKVLMLLTSGQAKVVKAIDDKNFKILAILGEGEVVGEMSFFDEAPHNASVVAHTPVTVLALSKKDFETILEKSTKTAIKMLIRIIQTCSQRIRTLNQEVKELGHWCISLRDSRK